MAGLIHGLLIYQDDQKAINFRFPHNLTPKPYTLITLVNSLN